MYSYGKGTILPALGISISCAKVSLTMFVCCSMLSGSPAFAPIGTKGAVALGVPFWRTTGGNAAIRIVGIPASSIALCTITAVLWQVPQPAVSKTASTSSSTNFLAISGPVCSVNAVWSPPPPMNPKWRGATSLKNPVSTIS